MKKVFFLFFIITSLLITSCLPEGDYLPRANNFKYKLATDAYKKCALKNPHNKSSCNVAHCLSSPVTLLALQELLVNVAEVFDELDVPYFIESGTFIGAKRFNAHLPWDDDVDLGVLRSDFNGKKIENFQRKIYTRGFTFKPLMGIRPIEKLSGYRGLWQVAYRKSKFIKLLMKYDPSLHSHDIDNLWLRYSRQGSILPHLDVFWYKKRGNHHVYEADFFTKQMQGPGLSEKMVKERKKINILGKDFYTVNGFQKYGEVMYNTKDLMNDFVISREHSRGCRFRLKDIRNHKKMLEYFIAYLEHVYTHKAAKQMGIRFNADAIRRRFAN